MCNTTEYQCVTLKLDTQFACFPWNGIPIELRSTLASRSFDAVVQTMTSTLGIILGGYLKNWKKSQHSYLERFSATLLFLMPVLRVDEGLTHHN